MSVHSPAVDDDAGKSLHDRAVDAAADVHAIQVGLAHAGASPQAIEALSHISDILANIAKTLAANPDIEDGAKNGPPGGPQGPLAPPPPGQAPPVPGAVGGPPPSGPFGPAAAALHQAMNGGKPPQNRA